MDRPQQQGAQLEVTHSSAKRRHMLALIATIVLIPLPGVEDKHQCFDPSLIHFQE